MFFIGQKVIIIPTILQRSKHERLVYDSNNWTEFPQSAETFRKPTDEKCSTCKKPSKTPVSEKDWMFSLLSLKGLEEAVG